MYALLAIASMVAVPAAAECIADAAQPHPHLLEEYTSEGCSSCPPADAWLRRSLGPDVAALAFHVDYWDDLGWRDRFAAAQHTQRQRAQAQRDGGSGIYTPQIVLDGRSWNGWYRGAAPTAQVPSRASLRVAIEDGPVLRVRMDASMAQSVDATGYRNYVAIAENGLSSDVRAGENRGVRLHHDAVVRVFAGPLPFAGAHAELSLPPDLDRREARLIAFVQRSTDGDVAQVLGCALP